MTQVCRLLALRALLVLRTGKLTRGRRHLGPHKTLWAWGDDLR